MNNPIRFNDPTGHVVCEVGEPCGRGASYVKETSVKQMTDNLKKSIKEKYGITISDSGDKHWTDGNVLIMYSSLYYVNNSLNGNLKSMVDGATFEMRNQDPKYSYHGLTALDGSTISFFTLGNNAIHQINIFHEIGHLIDSAPRGRNVFTHSIEHADDPSFLGDNGFINHHALAASTIGGVPAKQAYNTGFSEECADTFANYVAGNIDLSKPTGTGAAMYNFITGAFDEYFSDPTR